MELGHHLFADHRAGDLALPLPGDRRLDELGDLRSFSRPRVSNDNPYSAPPQRHPVRDTRFSDTADSHRHLQATGGGLQERPQSEPKALEPIHALLASTKGCVDHTPLEEPNPMLQLPLA